MPLPRVTLARQLAVHPALGKRKRHFEEYLVYAVLVLLFDGIFWANEVEGPSAGRLAAGLSFAVVATLILFQAYVVRLREKLARDREPATIADGTAPPIYDQGVPPPDDLAHPSPPDVR